MELGAWARARKRGAGGMYEGGLVGRVETGAQAQPVQIASLGTSTVVGLGAGQAEAKENGARWCAGGTGAGKRETG